jgi:hypothetical protein
MYVLKKNGKLFSLRVNLLGPGPLSYKQTIYRAAVSQRLGNTGLHHVIDVNLDPGWKGAVVYSSIRSSRFIRLGPNVSWTVITNA